MTSQENAYQYVTAIIAIVATAGLAAYGTVDAGVFSALVTLVLGYVFGRNVNTNARQR